MSFLDTAKSQANKILNEGKGGSPMGNPFLKTQSAQITKPGVPGVKPSVPGVKPVIPGKPSIPGVKPVIPGAKPVVPTKPTIPVAPVKEEEKATEELIAPMEPTTPVDSTPIKEEIKAPVEEVATETPVVEEIKEEKVTEETVEEKVEEVKEETVEEKVEEVKPKKNTRKKPAKKKATKVVEEIAEEEETEVVIPRTSISYTDACQSVRSHFVDPDWDKSSAYFEERARGIIISNDMNKAQLHDLLTQVDSLRDEMYLTFIQTKTLFEHLTEKDNGLIDIQKRLHGKGSNPEERKQNATVAVMNYKTPNGDAINLYELLAETRNRYNFLKGINDTIEFKKAVLLTMLSSLKK